LPQFLLQFFYQKPYTAIVIFFRGRVNEAAALPGLNSWRGWQKIGPAKRGAGTRFAARHSFAISLGERPETIAIWSAGFPAGFQRDHFRVFQQRFQISKQPLTSPTDTDE
jgi:hypothetical protein